MDTQSKFVSARECNVEMPNGLQWDGEDLWVIDQKSDDIFVIDQEGTIKKRIKTICENGSGITLGEGCIWLASNGVTTSRHYRSTDTHQNWVLKLDFETEKIINRYPTPDGGGVHGLEWDDGMLWITAFNPTALILVDPKNFDEVSKFEIDQSPHGLAIEGDSIWCSDRVARNIIRYNKTTGEAIEKIDVPEDGPDPHGLSIKDGILWYSDAAHPKPYRPYPEIGWIVVD